MLRLIFLAGLAFGASAAAQADEVIIHREAPVEVVTPPPAPHAVVIERHEPDCSTTRTRTEDEATGESTTVTRRHCE